MAFWPAHIAQANDPFAASPALLPTNSAHARQAVGNVSLRVRKVGMTYPQSLYQLL
jgi:hypothetical protein